MILWKASKTLDKSLHLCYKDETRSINAGLQCLCWCHCFEINIFCILFLFQKHLWRSLMLIMSMALNLRDLLTFHVLVEIKIKSFPTLVQPRYLFEVNGQHHSDLCNQWLEWEATELQVRSTRYSCSLWGFSQFNLITVFPFFVCTANIAAGPPHGSAAGKGVRGVQAPPGAAKLPGPKLEQGEDTIFNRGMSFTSPFRLLNFLSLSLLIYLLFTVHWRAHGKFTHSVKISSLYVIIGPVKSL